ncbi:CBU_0592 family membrane protein [Arenibacter lacus]|uniref:CBU_0592 family membrane protein n=1 Tax=Arenibacter lacus TaxID=2608629 RepID=UPI00123C8607|nr:hypothetical protein [Arenibacter lacus]
MNIYDFIGWTGFLLFIASYFLLSVGKLKAERMPYHFMNVGGGLCLVVSAYDTQSWPNLYTNLIWMLIGFYAIFLIVRKKKKT